jgi:hypothetical protein
MKRARLTWNTSVVFAVFGLSACTEYSIETTLNPDGSGQRVVILEATDPQRLGEGVTREEFVEYMSVSEQKGWSHYTEVQSDGDTTFVFKRETTIERVESWPTLDDEIHISGTRPFSADSVVGYLRLGDIQFRNRVRVVRADRGLVPRGDDAQRVNLGDYILPAGASVLSYEETFTWEHGDEAVVEVLVSQMERSVREAYPRLSSRDRAEIAGIARANVWSAIEAGWLDSIGEDEDIIGEEALDRVTRLAGKIVRATYPTVADETLRERLNPLSDESERELNERFERLIPGFFAAGSEIHFRLTMPGEVTNTNAHEREGNTLIWEFNSDDAIAAPVVLVAESVVRG